jgi:uncharacterized integral membrane protein
MRYVMWIFKFLLFVLVLTFAVMNTDPVAVRYFLGWEWQSPLIFVLLISFCAGIALGLTAGLGQILKQRREIAELGRKLRDAASREAAAATPAAPAAKPR